jgi:hypothetical protein
MTPWPPLAWAGLLSYEGGFSPLRSACGRPVGHPWYRRRLARVDRRHRSLAGCKHVRVPRSSGVPGSCRSRGLPWPGRGLPAVRADASYWVHPWEIVYHPITHARSAAGTLGEPQKTCPLGTSESLAGAPTLPRTTDDLAIVIEDSTCLLEEVSADHNRESPTPLRHGRLKHGIA